MAVPGRSHTHVRTPLRETRSSEGGGLGHLGQQRDGVCSLGRHGENVSVVFKGAIEMMEQDSSQKCTAKRQESMVINHNIEISLGYGGNIFLPTLHKQYQEHRGTLCHGIPIFP